MAAGIVVIAAIARWRLDSAAAYVAAGFAAAALWQLTPVKRWALRACHRAMPLAPQGWRAEMDCLRYGSTMGGYCLASCGVLMLACSLAGHSLPAMLGAAALGVVERYGPRVSDRMILGGICSFAAAYMIASLP
jgi:predicted metal-binding membrane protein